MTGSQILALLPWFSNGIQVMRNEILVVRHPSTKINILSACTLQFAMISGITVY